MTNNTSEYYLLGTVLKGGNLPSGYWMISGINFGSGIEAYSLLPVGENEPEKQGTILVKYVPWQKNVLEQDLLKGEVVNGKLLFVPENIRGSGFGG